MKRYILVPMVLLMLLCTLLLPGCNRPTPPVPSSTPQTSLPDTTPATTAPTGPSIPDGMVLVHLLTGYASDNSGEKRETSFVYDDAGRLLEVSIDAEIVVTYTYDAQGNCLSYKNTLCGIDQTYDAQGKLLTDRTEDGLITNTYDEAGRIISVERHGADGALLSVSRYTYDERGNLLSEALEQDGSVHHEILHTYDENGLHLTATYCRDGKISAEGPSYVWTYDSQGHLELEKIYYGEEFFQGTLFYYIPEADQTLAYMQWDSTGRLSEYGHTHDLDGNLTGYDESTRDADGNYTSIKARFSYDDHGNTIMKEYEDHTGQKQTFRWTYDESGTVMIGCSFTSASESYAYSWAYDANGKKIQEIRTGDAPHEITWEYDRRGRVSSVKCSGTGAYEAAYVYDEFGNLIQQTHTADSATAVADYTYTAFTVTPEVAAQLLAQQEEIFRYLNGEVD